MAWASPTSPPNATIRRIEWVTLSLGGQLVGVHVTAYDAVSGSNEVTTSDTGLFSYHTDYLGSVGAISDANGAVQGDIIRFGRLANCTAARRFIDPWAKMWRSRPRSMHNVSYRMMVVFLRVYVARAKIVGEITHGTSLPGVLKTMALGFGSGVFGELISGGFRGQNVTQLPLELPSPPEIRSTQWLDPLLNGREIQQSLTNQSQSVFRTIGCDTAYGTLADKLLPQ